MAFLGRGLHGLGYKVVPVLGYRTHLLRPEDRERDAVFEGLAAACFSSPSTVEAFTALLPGTSAGDLEKNLLVAALGATTRQSLIDAGFGRIVTAEAATPEAMAEAVAAGFKGDSDG